MFRWNRTFAGVLSVFLILYISLGDVPALTVPAAAQERAGSGSYQQTGEYDMPPPEGTSGAGVFADGPAGSTVRGASAVIRRGLLPYFRMYGIRGLTEKNYIAEAEGMPETDVRTDAAGISEADDSAGTGEMSESGLERTSVPFSAVPAAVDEAGTSGFTSESAELSAVEEELEEEESFSEESSAGAGENSGADTVPEAENDFEEGMVPERESESDVEEDILAALPEQYEGESEILQEETAPIEDAGNLDDDSEVIEEADFPEDESETFDETDFLEYESEIFDEADAVEDNSEDIEGDEYPEEVTAGFEEEEENPIDEPVSFNEETANLEDSATFVEEMAQEDEAALSTGDMDPQIENTGDEISEEVSEEVVFEEEVSEEVVFEETVPEEMVSEEEFSSEEFSGEAVSEEMVSDEAVSEGLISGETAPEQMVSKEAGLVSALSEEEAVSEDDSESDEVIVTETEVPDSETGAAVAPAQSAGQTKSSAVEVNTEASGDEPSGYQTNGSGSDPDGTNLSGSAASDRDLSATDPEATDPAVTDPSGTDPSGTGVPGAEQSAADPSETDTSGTNTTEADASEVDERASLKGMSLSLTDRIGVVVYAAVDATVEDDDYCEFICAGNSVSKTVAEAGSSQITDSAGEQVDVLAFELSLSSQQMTDEVAVHMVVDGVTGSEETFSVRSYADQVLDGDCPDTEKTLIRAMLNYGAYSQKYFGYNTENPANSGIFDLGGDPVTDWPDPDLSQYAYRGEDLSEKPNNGHWWDIFGYRTDLSPQIDISLNLGDEISLVYYYRWYYDYYNSLLGKVWEEIADNQAALGNRFRLTNTDVPLELGFDSGRNMHYAKLTGILPYELGNMYELEVTCGESLKWPMRLAYSPLSYCRMILESKTSTAECKNLYKSIYYYWAAASAVRNGE